MISCLEHREIFKKELCILAADFVIKKLFRGKHLESLSVQVPENA